MKKVNGVSVRDYGAELAWEKETLKRIDKVKE